MFKFEEKVLQQLKKMQCNLDSGKYGIAVSGGADSVSLLVAMSRILSHNPNTIKIITVNHNIREAAETLGDVQFTQGVCQELKSKGYKVECEVATIPPGYVQEICKLRKSGTEEAARFLRYKAFEKFISDNNLDYLCLAHNQNDQLETVLMRVLKGSSIEALGGINDTREKYIRPLINIQRKEIEDYLQAQGYSWRTDCTNLQTDYYRNKVRLQLVPVLNQLFPDWDKSVLSGSKKYRSDGDFIKSQVEAFGITQDKAGVSFLLSDFLALHESIQYRVLLRACNMAGETARIPYEFLMDCTDSFKNHKDAGFSKFFGSIEIIEKKGKVFVKKQSNSSTDLVFFDIIEETGSFSFPFGNLEVRKNETSDFVEMGFNENWISVQSKLPLIIRNICIDDMVKTADGNEKKVADILADWHVQLEDRSLIPVVQELENSEQKIVCIAGAFMGYKDWIVKL